jgi:hypothetical protein
MARRGTGELAMSNGYTVDYVCHECGETHRVANDFRFVGGPSEAGSLDDLYPGGDLPPEVENLLGDMVWCDQASEWVELEDPAGVILRPQRPSR